ncbi:MAG: sugar ABC transporter permease [Spirochaetaceae bacterium]|nr:MAG: sugar ABC transporter permease [Spirochaetaceae bacterium]
MVQSLTFATTRSRRNAISGYLFISPWLIGFITLTIFPIIAVVYLGFTRYDIFSAPQWTGLANYRRMFTADPRFWTSVRSTFVFAFSSVPLKLAFALAVAMVLAAKRRGVGVYRALYYAPSIVGTSVAVAVMWRQIFARRGLVNWVLGFLGLPSTTSWLGEPATAIWTIVLLVVWQFGSPMLIFLAGLKQIPAEMYEAADIDGARAHQRFFRITLPMLSPIILFNLIMQIIFGLTVFTQAFIITGGGPLDTTNFYALYLYRRAFETFQMGYGSAMAVVLLAVVGVCTAIVLKTSARWVFYETE